MPSAAPLLAPIGASSSSGPRVAVLQRARGFPPPPSARQGACACPSLRALSSRAATSPAAAWPRRRPLPTPAYTPMGSPRAPRAGAGGSPGAAGGAPADPPGDPPPYAALSMPVYSMATSAPTGGLGGGPPATMNITTYASPVSINPRKFAVGLYKGTTTHEYFCANKGGVLQILRERHAPLLELLGRTSGRDVDKISELRGRGFEVVEQLGAPTLGDCLGVVRLALSEGAELVDCGDHHVAMCDVLEWKTIGGEGEREGDAALYTGFLRAQGLL